MKSVVIGYVFSFVRDVEIYLLCAWEMKKKKKGLYYPDQPEASGEVRSELKDVEMLAGVHVQHHHSAIARKAAQSNIP